MKSQLLIALGLAFAVVPAYGQTGKPNAGLATLKNILFSLFAGPCFFYVPE